MALSRLAPHIQHTNDEDGLLTVLSRWQPEHPLVMDNFALARKMVDGWGAQPIHRRYTDSNSKVGHEGSYHKGDVDALWAFLSDERHPEIWLNVGNEPGGIDTREQWDTLARFYIGIMNRAKRDKQPVVVANFGVGFGKRSQFDDGWVDEFIRHLVNCQPYVKLGLHAYAPISLRLGMGRFNLWECMTPSQMAFNERNWPSKTQWTHERINGDLPGYWYIGRAYWWHIRAREIGAIGPDEWLPIAITEFGLDDIPDAKKTDIHGKGPDGEMNIYEAIVGKYGHDGYPGIRGWRSLWDYKETIYERSLASVYAQELDWVDKHFYASGAVDSINLFTVAVDGDKGSFDWKHHGFNHWPPDTLIDELIRRQEQPAPPVPTPPVPIPPPAPKPNWREQLTDERIRQEVALAETYMREFGHGTPGHLSYSTIAALAALLDTE